MALDIVDAGRDAVLALFAVQSERIRVLEAAVEELNRLIARSSNNSSLPPSRDSRQARERGPRSRPRGRSRIGSRPFRPASSDGREPRSCG